LLFFSLFVFAAAVNHQDFNLLTNQPSNDPIEQSTNVARIQQGSRKPGLVAGGLTKQLGG